MKTLMMMLLAGCAAFAATAQSESNPPWVLPVDDAGVPLENQKIRMTEQADGLYTASGVTLGKGFLFEGVGENESTYYALRAGAVTPAVEGLPNPVSISSSDRYIPVGPGTYDIVFDAGRSTGYRHFIITPSEGEVRPPQKLFLLVSSGSSVKAVEMDALGDGVFSLRGTAIPASFKVAYEPIDQAPYIFGPVMVPAPVELAVPVPLERSDNSTFSFVYSPTVRQASDELTVTLDGEKASLLLSNLILTEIEDVSAARPSLSADLYDLSGRPVSGDAPAPGLYIDAAARALVRVR